MAIEFSGYLKDGKMYIRNRATLDSAIAKSTIKEFTGKLERKKKKRSTSQNSYYWVAVVPILLEGFREMGHEFDSDDVHEFVKANFNHEVIINEDTGETYTRPRSTTGISTTEFMEMIAKIQKFGAEFLNVYIPDPGEQVQLWDQEDNSESCFTEEYYKKDLEK